ncbi:hypothetical protein ASZ90_015111 [hydrocarbon metagenome]|uniref:Uncharacterized protein n=1 Tax=hydrocarbon metagenome TaxID=938273 RepID=A0A0W8F4B2_9ZZZZ
MFHPFSLHSGPVQATIFNEPFRYPSNLRPERQVHLIPSR